MTRAFQIVLIITLTAAWGIVAPAPAPADEMVVFKNGRTLRADELKLENGAYRITTMAGGVMEVPVRLVERVITCVVDKEVEEQRGTVPAGAPSTPMNPAGGRSSVTKIPPAGGLGGGAAPGRGSLGAGRAGGRMGGATAIPPRGGRSLGRPGGGDKSNPVKGGEEKK